MRMGLAPECPAGFFGKSVLLGKLKGRHLEVSSHQKSHKYVQSQFYLTL